MALLRLSKATASRVNSLHPAGHSENMSRSIVTNSNEEGAGFELLDERSYGPKVFAPLRWERASARADGTLRLETIKPVPSDPQGFIVDPLCPDQSDRC